MAKTSNTDKPEVAAQGDVDYRGKSAVRSAFVFFEHHEMLLTCEGRTECSSNEVTLHESQTCYVDDGKGEDPNRSCVLCEPCAVEHHAHWDAMWDDYNSGRL